MHTPHPSLKRSDCVFKRHSFWRQLKLKGCDPCLHSVSLDHFHSLFSFACKTHIYILSHLTTILTNPGNTQKPPAVWWKLEFPHNAARLQLSTADVCYWFVWFLKITADSTAHTHRDLNTCSNLLQQLDDFFFLSFFMPPQENCFSAWMPYMLLFSWSFHLDIASFDQRVFNINTRLVIVHTSENSWSTVLMLLFLPYGLVPDDAAVLSPTNSCHHTFFHPTILPNYFLLPFLCLPLCRRPFCNPNSTLPQSPKCLHTDASSHPWK